MEGRVDKQQFQRVFFILKFEFTSLTYAASKFCFWFSSAFVMASYTCYFCQEESFISSPNAIQLKC